MSALDPAFNYPKARSRDLQTILETEGEWTSLFTFAAPTITSASQTNVTIAGSGPSATAAGGTVFTQPYIGRCLWVESVTIGLSQDAVIQVGQIGDLNGKYPAWNFRSIVKANTPLVIPVRQFWRQRRVTIPSLVLSVRNFIPSLSVDTVVTGSINILGHVLTDDLNFYAPKTMLVVGDSLDYGDGFGATRSEKLHTHIVRDYLRGQGADVRLASLAQPGMTSAMVYDDMVRGRFDPFQPSVCFYKIGTNDALLAAGGFVNTWSANMLAFWNRMHAQAPNCKVIIVPPGPLNDNTNESNAALIRTRAASDVASVNSPYLKVCDISAAFDRTNTSFFKAADQVHWSDTGHAAVAAVETAFLAAQGITA